MSLRRAGPDEVELELVEKARAQDLLGDARAAGDRDVPIARRRPSLLDCALDAVRDERVRRPSLLDHGVTLVVGEDEHRDAERRVVSPPTVRVRVALPGPSPPLNIRLPMSTAPVLARASSATSSSASAAPPEWPCCSRQLASRRIHSWSRSPPSPRGSSREGFGPATNPSSDDEMSTTTFPMAVPATRPPPRAAARLVLGLGMRRPRTRPAGAGARRAPPPRTRRSRRRGTPRGSRR